MGNDRAVPIIWLSVFTFGTASAISLSRFQRELTPVFSAWDGRLLPFTTYAQYFEDLILYHALSHVRNGFYVDVGANHPSRDSVTRAFYLMNWSGVNIEPLQHHYADLLRYRPRDINLNLAVGDCRSSLHFWEQDGFSTLDLDEGKKYGPPTRMIQVYPLSEIVTNYSVAVCHFCKIDVEGFERQVLNGIDFAKWRPWTFCVEATLPGTTIPCHDRWEFILLGAGYRLGCTAGINRYYYDTINHPELAPGMICNSSFHLYRIKRPPEALSEGPSVRGLLPLFFRAVLSPIKHFTSTFHQ
jgi:FkbM family methyltransferase